MKVRIGPYRKNRAFNIEIESFDTWSMDHTLAPIILPMLIQLQETKHGSPFVDNEDVPEELRMPDSWYESEYNKNGETDEKFHERWNWVLEEIIYAFDCKANKDEIYMRFDIEDRDAMNNEQDRISNGFRLFGKYYEDLWD